MSWSLNLSKSLFKFGILLISLVTTLQIIFSYFYYILLYENISESDAQIYGIVLNKAKYLPNYIVIFVLHCFATMYVRKTGIKQENKELKTNLIEEKSSDEFYKDESSDESKHESEEVKDSSEESKDSSEESQDSSEDSKSSSKNSKNSKNSKKSSKKSIKIKSLELLNSPKNEFSSIEINFKTEKSLNNISLKLEKKSRVDDNPFEENKKSKKDKKEDNQDEKNLLKMFKFPFKCKDSIKLIVNPTLLLFFGRVFLFCWIFYFKSGVGLYLMFWIFYSILERDHDRVIIVSRFILIPVLTIILLLSYIFNTFSIESSYLFGVYYRYIPAVELLFQQITLLVFLLINRVFGYRVRVSQITTESKDT